MKRVLLLLVLAGCPKGMNSAGGGFRVFFPDADAMNTLHYTVGAHSQAKPSADCKVNGVDARWATTGAQVTTGLLPPGMQMEDGAIVGVPSAAGTYKATIRYTGVTCGATPTDDKLVHVTIVVSG
ncbi:MAG TPA: hypothetical protein VGM90_27700 [Kofleriaceae bacterium]|jgi:hypothetical protein